MRPVFRRRMIRATIGGAAAVSLASVGALGMTQAFASPASVQAAHGQLSVTSEPFGTAPAGPYNPAETVFRYTLTNEDGVQVRILTYGGIVQSVNVPDKWGHSADVVLGFKTLQEYVNEVSPPPPAGGGPYFGEIIGRYGNRIAGGTFTLHGKTYTLPKNNNGNTLHGGFVGFGNRVWSATKVTGNGEVGVELTLHSPNGDEGSAFEPSCGCTGFPGNVTVHVTYTLDNSGALKIHYTATTDAPTVLNLTNHSYFNLAGESTLSAMGQKVYMNADKITTVNSLLIPDGKFASVDGTPFDFTDPAGTAIGARINDGTNQQLLFGPGYDHNWVINSTGPKLDGLLLDARATDPGSGRELTVWSSEPGVQFYAGNFLTGTLVGIGNHTYRQGAGYTFETQHFPDSPNQPGFPSTEVDPGHPYDTTTIFKFSS
jgi:aldose 1-epimerase